MPFYSLYLDICVIKDYLYENKIKRYTLGVICRYQI